MYIFIFNYVNLMIPFFGLVEKPYKIEKIFNIDSNHFLDKARNLLFDSVYPITLHPIIMLLVLLIWNFFFVQPKPAKPFKFYLIFIFLCVSLLAIGHMFWFEVQFKLISEKYIISFDMYKLMKTNPILWITLPAYHYLIISFFSIWFYKFLLKK